MKLTTGASFHYLYCNIIVIFASHIHVNPICSEMNPFTSHSCFCNVETIARWWWCIWWMYTNCNLASCSCWQIPIYLITVHWNQLISQKYQTCIWWTSIGSILLLWWWHRTLKAIFEILSKCDKILMLVLGLFHNQVLSSSAQPFSNGLLNVSLIYWC